MVDIMLGCAVDAPLRAISATVGEHRAIAPGGAILPTPPATNDRSAGDATHVHSASAG